MENKKTLEGGGLRRRRRARGEMGRERRKDIKDGEGRRGGERDKKMIGRRRRRRRRGRRMRGKE